MSKKNKKLQAQSILATVVMGMNCANSIAPAVALAAAEPPPQLLRQNSQQEYDYEVLPALAGCVEELFCASAEASTVTVGSGASSSFGNITHDVIVQAGGSATITSNGGELLVNGGNATVGSNGFSVSVNEGSVHIGENKNQVVVYGGTCDVETVTSGGYSDVYGGLEHIGTMAQHSTYNHAQNIYNDAVGIIDVLDGRGTDAQNIGVEDWGAGSSGHPAATSGAYGCISTMNGGNQYIHANASGHVVIMNSGLQQFFNGSNSEATIEVMVGGTQKGAKNCSVAIGTMSGGTQTVVGQGSIDKMINGQQTVGWYAQGAATSGLIKEMAGGLQVVYSGYTGMVSSMTAGQQQANSGGTAIVEHMHGSGATQIVGVKGTAGSGSITTLDAGTQIIGYAAGCAANGDISEMNGGAQMVGRSGGGSGNGSVAVMNSGLQQINAQSIGTVDTMNGGQQQINSGGTGTVSNMSNGSQIVQSGGLALNTTLKGGIQIVSGGGTAVSTSIGSGGVQYLEDGANVSGTVLTGGSMRFDQGVSAYSLADTLTVNGGSIDLSNRTAIEDSGGIHVYQRLTVSNLQGDGGSLYLDTDLAGSAGDQMIVASANTGTGSYDVHVKDLSSLNNTEVTGAHELLLITDNSNKLTFKGAAANFGGLWDVDPTLEQKGSDWYLTKLAKTANNDTKVLLDAADNSYSLWRYTNDSLRGRLGELTDVGDSQGGKGKGELAVPQRTGIWAQVKTGRFDGSGYEGRYNLYQLGFDQYADAKSIYGLSLDYGDGTGGYDKGSGKDKLKNFSFYGVWQDDSGAYTNVTLRAGIFDTDLYSYGDYPDNASYKEHSYSVSAEYGKRFALRQGLFFEPQAELTLGRLDSISYTTNRGANGYIEGMNSAVGRIGFVIGQKIKGGSDIYLKADLLHEFAGERELRLTSAAGGTKDILTKHNDYGDTWFELGLGGNIRLSRSGNFYGEIERGFGGNINKKWQLNAGLRFEF